MKIKELMDLSESSSLSDLQKECISDVLAAINDWPEFIDNIDLINYRLHHYIGVSSINIVVLKDFMNSLSLNDQAWNIESLQGFYNILEKSDCSTIEEVFKQIKSWYEE